MKNKIVLLDIDYTLFDTKLFKESNLTKYSLYAEILPTLKILASVADLGIFSKGEGEFQTNKLQETGLGDFFRQENVHIFDNKDLNLEKVIAKYKGLKIFLIDDKLTTLYNAKIKTPDVFTIWIKRGPFAQDETLLGNFSPDATITSLKEAVRIISD
jgi:FMN phosphatase YigB (HAD superfamily)